MSTETKPKVWLRKLDIDDLYLLKLSHDGLKCCDIARTLSLSFPAISQRVKKISRALEIPIFSKVRSNLVLTESGKVVAATASAAIDILALGIARIEREEFAPVTKSKKVLDIEKQERVKVDCGFLGDND